MGLRARVRNPGTGIAPGHRDGRGGQPQRLRGDSPNNFIEVTHTDNTTARYLHIEQGSAAVATGDAVARGDRLANIGNVGNSITGHVHFTVEDASGNSVAVSFSDVDDDAGIPRTFGTYTSGNR